MRELAAQLNLRLAFRLADGSPGVRLRTARELLDSEHPNHQAAGRAMYAAAMGEQRLAERDQRLLAGGHPGFSDQRYLSACRYAETWGLPQPPARRRAA